MAVAQDTPEETDAKRMQDNPARTLLWSHGAHSTVGSERGAAPGVRQRREAADHCTVAWDGTNVQIKMALDSRLTVGGLKRTIASRASEHSRCDELGGTGLRLTLGIQSPTG